MRITFFEVAVFFLSFDLKEALFDTPFFSTSFLGVLKGVGVSSQNWDMKK